MLSVWSALDPRRRVIVTAATVAVFVAVLLLGRMAAAPGMALLYAGLESAAAGEVVQVLEQRGVPYEVRGDAIYIAARSRDETRMMLAAQGLPASSAQGYELLDALSGFGTTSQMFDAAHLRAKEGELARTIMASPQVRAARVHLAVAPHQSFRREIPPTASVTVTTGAGSLPPGQVQALKFLVASAVAGLRPEEVSVIDAAGGLLLSGDDDRAGAGPGSPREAELRRAVERLLEAHVGHGRAVVELSIETVTETESIIERRLDPEGRVAVLADSEERSSSSTDSRDGGVTVASNLPDGDAATGGRAQTQDAETRERLTYEVSEIRREVQRVPGAIRRLSVAVMVDGVIAPDDQGTPAWRPRPEPELEALRDLVASAVGFDAARGDVITLRSLPFEPVAALGTGAPAGMFDGVRLDLMALIQLAVLALVSLALILFVIRPILMASRRLTDPADGQVALPGAQPSALPGIATAAAAAGAETLPVQSGALAARATDLTDPDDATDPVARLRRLIEERQEESVEILRSWMEEDEEERAR